MEIRAARAEELEAIVEMLCRAYRPELRPRATKHLWEDSSYQLHQSRVCLVEGKIVSYVRVSDRPIRIGKCVVRMGGIGAVGTHPDHRQRGYATATLQDAIRYMEEQGYDLSMLFTGIQPFYARLGWVPFPEHIFSLDFTALPPRPPSPYLVRPFAEERDLEAVRRIYEEHNCRRTGTLVRWPQYWLDGHSRLMGVLPSHVVEREGQVWAYGGVSFRETGAWVREVGFAPGHAAAMLTLAWTVLDETAQRGGSRVEGLLPRNHPFGEALSEVSGRPLAHRLSEGLMLRLLNLPSLLGKIAPELTERAQTAGLAEGHYALRLTVQGQSALLCLEGGQVNIREKGAAEWELPLDARSFFKLVLGDSTARQMQEVWAMHGLRVEGPLLRLLEALFPPQEPVYWGCDHF
ncbi:MAG TPA: GNAT family N-acetyltransferase [Armatimonadetes bacterium]|nr:GNAT family N-acetyltransferase [Armatimonadota bacterium]